MPCPRCSARGPTTSMESDREHRGSLPMIMGSLSNPMPTVAENLKLLAIFHYVLGGISGLFSLFPILHLVIGLSLLTAPNSMFKPGANASGDPQMFRLFGLFFVFFAAFFIICGLCFAASVAVAGWFLQKRKHYLYCMVIAGIECAFVPFGTVLGVFTIITLQKPEIQQLFGRSPARAAPTENGRL
jgi:hypothetical protein